ncbi:beta-glucosidase [Natronospirillum operosum]|uniref:Beta-glucosidase n=1 Tax=Natronospirillum operosum TaxID=2759953 RepID=A0A4Z0W977_9GAMM|nr:GH1 family beta-glucosidase [Natronospirillum operosum]TGG90651.1 beta-glucosidase [Natronospirillum operosum]
MQFDIPQDSPVRRSDFVFGVATAAFQVEGHRYADGRTDSIWDTFCEQPGRVLNGDNGEPACDHYERWEEDLDMMQAMGVDAYRFSIAWPRIVPAPGVINEAGLAFYEQLVDGMIARGIRPVATLYHWDLPQYLDDQGGWLSRSTAEAFADYAEVVVRRLGDRVTHWATFNEPFCSAFLGYEVGNHAPGHQRADWAFAAAHNLLLAHGLALPRMRAAAPNSAHGIVLNFTPSYAATDKPADVQAARARDTIEVHWFIAPLLEGRYPDEYFDRHPEHAPTIEPGDMELIRQPLDFIGVNFYTRHVVRAGGDGPETVPQPDREHTHIGWEVYPRALTELLIQLRRDYPALPPLYITENGMAGDDHLENGAVHDPQRVSYYERHIAAVGDAMADGVDVRGYFAWSLMDNFEWAFGYSQRFGLIYVDYQTQERTLKSSAHAYSDWLRTRHE